jgi:hypothetical protein
MRNVFPIVLLVVLVFFLIPNYKINQEKIFDQLENGCLVYSLHHKLVLDAQEMLEPYLWTRVLAIEFYNTVVGHAVTVFVYKNITFIYDPNRGSFVAARFPLYDPLTLAEICFPKIPVKDAVFIEPTLTLNSPIF